MLEIPETWNMRQGTQEAMSGSNFKAIGVELPNPNRNHIIIPCALDAKYGATGFSVYPSGFWSFLGPAHPFYAAISTFWSGNFLSVPLYIGSM
jgi:hypothetical protein